MDVACPEWTWLVVVGVFAAFLFGWGTGSNDVANAFGTSVGAKTLTLRQAVVIAAIFEFGGALLLGRVSTGVIQGGIANLSTFAREPAIYAYGMVCAMAVGGIWQGLASYMELNVSATHSIIGAIIGFSLVYGGKDAINWATPEPKLFPPYSGVVPIVCAWVFAPLATASAAALIMYLCRTFVLRRQNPARLAMMVLPLAVFITTWINIYFVFTKGAKKLLTSSSDDWSDSKALWIAAVCAAGLSLLTATVAVPILWKRLDKQFSEEANAADSKDTAVNMPKDAEIDPEEPPKGILAKMQYAVSYGTSVDIHQAVEEDDMVAAIHENAEVFDPKAEQAFAYLQVFSAICVIFAHGSGEVGYMTGPLGAVWQVYTTGRLEKNIDPPIWQIVICASALVVGLATYGYNVTRAMGVRLAKLSPARGFAAELATSMVILVASQYGLPTSSSQCITGGIVGVGLLEGVKGVNFKVFGKQLVSWVGTLFIMGFCTAALFSQAVFAPSITTGKVVLRYENAITGLTNNMNSQLNSTLLAFKPAVDAGVTKTLTQQNWADYNSSLNAAMKQIKALAQQQSSPEAYLTYLYQALAMYQNNTVFTMGQNNVSSNLYTTALPICNNADSVTINDGVKCSPPSLLPKDVTVKPVLTTALP